MFSYENLKKILFLLEPEKAHHLAECGLKVVGKCKILRNYYEKKNYICDSKLNQELFDLFI